MFLLKGSVLLPCIEKISRNFDLAMSKFRLNKWKPTPTVAMFEEAIRMYFLLVLKHNDVLECLAHINLKIFRFVSAKEPIRSSERCSVFDK